jgi:hypothetical protein
VAINISVVAEKEARVTFVGLKRIGSFVALALVAQGCAGAGTSAALGARAAAAQPLALHIAAPSAEAEVSLPFEVKLESNVPLGSPETGFHHVHLYFDQATPDGPYDLVYGDTFQVSNLSPGRHTILASLRNSNHRDAGPMEMIAVTVASGADAGDMAGTNAPGPETQTSPAEDYGY